MGIDYFVVIVRVCRKLYTQPVGSTGTQADRAGSRRVVSRLGVIRGVVVDVRWMHSMSARTDLMLRRVDDAYSSPENQWWLRRV